MFQQCNFAENPDDGENNRVSPPSQLEFQCSLSSAEEEPFMNPSEAELADNLVDDLPEAEGLLPKDEDPNYFDYVNLMKML
jgi:hypothetical protein